MFSSRSVRRSRPAASCGAGTASARRPLSAGHRVRSAGPGEQSGLALFFLVSLVLCVPLLAPFLLERILPRRCTLRRKQPQVVSRVAPFQDHATGCSSAPWMWYIQGAFNFNWYNYSHSALYTPRMAPDVKIAGVREGPGGLRHPRNTYVHSGVVHPTMAPDMTYEETGFPTIPLWGEFGRAAPSQKINLFSSCLCAPQPHEYLYPLCQGCVALTTSVAR